MIKKILKNTIKQCAGLCYYYSYKKYFNNIGNRTLIYHAFGSKLNHDNYGISIKINKFKEHIKYLLDNYDFHALTKSFNNKFSVSITIDDGYKDTIEAVSILNNFNIPFSLFITTDSINTKQYLSDEDIVEISKLKFAEIGSHGKSHNRLQGMSYANQKLELLESKIKLEKITSKKINSISFPHGSYNSTTLKLLNEIKYKRAATSIKGFNNYKTNKYMIHRNEIISSDSIKELEKKIKGYYDFY